MESYDPYGKYNCPDCSYGSNYPNNDLCQRCMGIDDGNLNEAKNSVTPTLNQNGRLRTRDRLANIFECLKVAETLSSNSEKNNRTGLTPTSPSLIQKENSLFKGAGLSSSIENNDREKNSSELYPMLYKNNELNEPPFEHSIKSMGGDSKLISTSPYGAIGSNKCSTQSISSSSHGTQLKSNEYEKWSCVLCTYENWPRAIKCVMCLTPRGKSTTLYQVSPEVEENMIPYPNETADSLVSLRDDISPASNNRIVTGSASMGNTKKPRMIPNNRKTRELDRKWLEACNGVVDGNISPVESFLAAGGHPSRQLTATEVAILDRPSAFEVGLTLIHLALRFQQEHLLDTLLSQVDANCPTVVKRVPAYAAPDVANEVRRHVTSMIRQHKGNFRCLVVSEVATFFLPSEIEDYPTDLQETVFDEVLDRDVQKELDDGQIINWSTEILEQFNSRLYALWNRSAGDCLLDSVLQATWAIFDQDNCLRQALSDSLQECSTMFYQRWKENELLHADLLHFSLNETQCANDWANLISIASKPGSSLEQLHIFVLAHILRRPIIVYGVKIVKSFRGETLGYAHYEGLYLPFFWEPGFCYKSPICLGYTRGHFSALVTIEPDCDPMSSSASAAQLLPEDIINRCSYLPLTSVDGNLLPIQFLTQAELGKEEMIMNQWLDVRYTDTGLMVACQEAQTAPLVVSQMVDEWLNHYRRLGQLNTTGSYLRQTAAPCYSSDGESDE